MTRSPLSVLVSFPTCMYLFECPDFKRTKKCFVKDGLDKKSSEKLFVHVF